MDVYSDYYNPGNYDDRLIAEKLGFSKKSFDLNEKLRNDDLEEKLRKSQQELKRARKELELSLNKPSGRREHFTVGGCGCGCDNMSNPTSTNTTTTPNAQAPQPNDTIFGMPMRNFLIMVVAVFMAVIMFQHNQLTYEIRELKNILRPQQTAVQVNTPTS